MIIEEDYVSFETSQLLKEKGFDVPVYRGISINNLIITKKEPEDFNNKISAYCSQPTLQMVMKWLRELYNLHCDISYHFRLGWYIKITSLKETVIDHDIEMKTYPIFNTIDYSSYEEACENAIRYCLKELI